MRVTDIIKQCSRCNKEFRVFSDDGSGDRTICWNYCPHCGSRNEIWLRLVNPDNRADREISVGVGYEEAQKVRQ